MAVGYPVLQHFVLLGVFPSANLTIPQSTDVVSVRNANPTHRLCTTPRQLGRRPIPPT
jgi:hypothetical protein